MRTRKIIAFRQANLYNTWLHNFVWFIPLMHLWRAKLGWSTGFKLSFRERYDWVIVNPINFVQRSVKENPISTAELKSSVTCASSEREVPALESGAFFEPAASSLPLQKVMVQIEPDSEHLSHLEIELEAEEPLSRFLRLLISSPPERSPASLLSVQNITLTDTACSGNVGGISITVMVRTLLLFNLLTFEVGFYSVSL